MPIMLKGTEPTSWIICFSMQIDGKLQYIREEFTGSIREAMFHEMLIRGLVKDGLYII